MKWILPPFAQIQSRFSECELPPESNANYAFILTALDKIDGRAAFIMPTSILSTNNRQEKAIRKHLVEMNYIDAVITCPDKMFESTNIQTCLIVFDKKKRTTMTTLIDMSQSYETEMREQNGQYGGKAHEGRTYRKEMKVFSANHMKKALDAISERSDIPCFCKTVSLESIRRNDYCLIPLRYIEFQYQETHRAYKDIVRDYNRVVDEKNACKLTINETLAKTLGFDTALYQRQNTDDEPLNALLEKLSCEKMKRCDYFSTTKNKGELKFENKSKEMISSVLMMILSTWKQHIYYLNQEENRYLAELRDALLSELMSGKIELSEGGD